MTEQSQPVPVPTQVKRPWRATARTVFQFILGAAVILPFMVEATGLEPEAYPWLAGILAVAAGVTRVMALPQVEAFLQRFLPFLAATPRAQILGKAFTGGTFSKAEEDARDQGASDVVTVLAVVVLVIVLLAFVGAL